MYNANKNRRDINSGWHYTAPAVFLHWLLALLIAGMVGLGWTMMAIERQPNSGWYFDLHKSVGLLVFGLVLLRMLWRFNHKPAALPVHLPTWQVKSASVAHWLLYACMMLMPLTGFISALLSKSGAAFFGLSFPTRVAPNHERAEQLFSIHSTIAWILVGLVAMHALVGLKHALIDKDNVFQRMWF